MTSQNVMGAAREWLITMRTSADTEFVRSEFEAWVLEDPEHLRAFARAESEWIRLDKAVNLLRQKGPMPPEALLKEIHDTAACTRRRRRLMKELRNWSVRLALALGVIVLLTSMAHFPEGQPTRASWDRSGTSFFSASGGQDAQQGQRARGLREGCLRFARYACKAIHPKIQRAMVRETSNQK